LRQTAQSLGLHQRGNDRGRLALARYGGGDRAGSLADIGHFDHTSEMFLRAFHLGEGKAELLADAGIGG